MEGGGYLTEDQKPWVPSWNVFQERIFSTQPQSYNDDDIKFKGRYTTKGKVASSFAKFIPFEEIPAWPKTLDEQEF